MHGDQPPGTSHSGGYLAHGKLKGPGLNVAGLGKVLPYICKGPRVGIMQAKLIIYVDDAHSDCIQKGSCRAVA